MLRTVVAVLLACVTVGSMVTPSSDRSVGSAPQPLSVFSHEPISEKGSAIGGASAAAGRQASGSTVLINELANGGARSTSDSFFELRNFADVAIDLDGWNIYRCDAMGLRTKAGHEEADLSGVTLAPGQIFTASMVGMAGDAHTSVPFAAAGFGLYLEGPEGELVDRVAVYPNEPWPTMSECSANGNLPNVLNLAHDESWQRVAVTGDPPRDFRVAPATLGQKNRASMSASASASLSARAATPAASVVISEFAPTGPAGGSDEFVELTNYGTRAADISGWRMFRCTANGRLTPDTLQLTVPDGTTLAAGRRWVAAPQNGFTGRADARYETPFANLTAGVLVETGDGTLVDRVSISSYGDSACQGPPAGRQAAEADATELPALELPAPELPATKLPAVLDPVAGESYQRSADASQAFLIASRTPGRVNATEASAVFDEAFAYPSAPSVAISEVATDPPQSELPVGSRRQNFVELGNYGGVPVDIGGWTIRRCEESGIRSRDLQLAIPAGTILRPGGTYLAAREGTATRADATFSTAFNMLGTGVWIADADGGRVDSVGVYAVNEMDADNITASPCTKRFALTTYQPDRMLGETFQRRGFSGTDADDFTTAAATPGTIDRPDTSAGREAAGRETSGQETSGQETSQQATSGRETVEAETAGRESPGSPLVSQSPLSAAHLDSASPLGTIHAVGEARLAAARNASASGDELDIVRSWTGASEGGPLRTRHGSDEQTLDRDESDPGLDALTATDDGWRYPYHRFTVRSTDVPADGIIEWTGQTYGRAELQLSVWNDDAASWRLLDSSSGAPGTPAVRSAGTIAAPGSSPSSPPNTAAPPLARVQLDGRLTSSDLGADTVTLLVQAGPRMASPQTTPGFADPDDYDFAISHITDTQYLSESYPEVYSGLADWIVDNAAERKIEFVTHTGDLVQNWVDAAQNDVRARREFDRASDAQALLDDAAIANSVLPGNHDNKRGVDNDLFNEYFGPDRYAASPAYGGSIAPGDNSANFSTFSHEGASFLMLSLPYGYGEREIAWAETVVVEHPRHNVVLSTHEHVTPKTHTADAGRSVTSRWMSRADQLWQRVIAPNRNVVMVLSGHFHGLGKIVTEDAGGLEGHTVVELLADYQEFRTDTGERATGFQRLLQIDLAGGTIDIDTFSAHLGESHSFGYDYPSFEPEDGRASTFANARPWNIVGAGLTDRYSAADDEFTERVVFQHPKLVATTSVSVTGG